MRITGPSHIGVHVKDLERSLAFYRDLLGLQQVARFDESDDVVRSAVGYEDASLKTAHVLIPNSDMFMEIIEYVCPRGAPVDPQAANPGTTHLTFYVDDLETLYAELVKAGVKPVGTLTEIPDADRENGPVADMPHLHRIVGGKTVYMQDPDGIRIELIEPST